MRHRRLLVGMRAGELNMTAMIDVAFQLLAFFIITTQAVPIFAHLNVLHPSELPGDHPAPMVRIMVCADTVTINDRSVDVPALDGVLGRLAALDRRQTVLIVCVPESPHARLVQVLDLCAKAGLDNLSVVSSL